MVESVGTAEELNIGDIELEEEDLDQMMGEQEADNSIDFRDHEVSRQIVTTKNSRNRANFTGGADTQLQRTNENLY